MYLTRHHTDRGPRWAVDGHFLPDTFDLRLLLALHAESVREFLNSSVTNEKAIGVLLPPLEPVHEVWGCLPLEARKREQRRSTAANVPTERVYAAERPALYFKAPGWRVVGHHAPVRVRDDSAWNISWPELALVINRHHEVIGYTAGGDVSARSLESENPLYVSQARLYNGACAIGPGLELSSSEQLRELPISIEVTRGGRSAFRASATIAQLNRSTEDLIAYLTRELDFPHGVFLLMGSPVVFPADFTLSIGDRVTISVGALTLENEVAA